MMTAEQSIIFYDGSCGLCDASVCFVLRADRKKIFLFAPLQGKTAEVRLADYHHLNLDSVVLMEPDRVLMRGKALLRICWLLGGAWVLLGWLSFLPPWPFDQIYDFVARHRYRFFKKKPFCDIPTGDVRERFLD